MIWIGNFSYIIFIFGRLYEFIEVHSKINQMGKLNYLAAILVIFLIGACQTSSDVSIGFLMPDGEGSRWPIDQGYIETAAKANGYEVISRYVENDENLQQKQARELLEMGVDALIVVSVNSNTAAAIVRDAHEYDVPVIGYDRIILNSDLDYIVTFEGAQIGNMMIDHAIEKVPRGNYVLLWGDAGDKNAIFIQEAQEETLKPYVDNGSINVVYKGFVDNWSVDVAHKMMTKILDFTDKNIDAVITSYDGLAMGALKALEEHPEQSCKVLTGQDAEIRAVRAINKGEMSLTVYKSIKQIAEASVDLAGKLAKGEKIEHDGSTLFNGRKEVPAIMITPIAVTKSTIDETVIADGFYTVDEVYGE